WGCLISLRKESTMFSHWFSGDECGQYCTSPHKQRMDQVGSSLLELRYANDVIRQHLPRSRRTRRVSPACWLSSSCASLVYLDSDAVFAVCANASRTGCEND